MHGYDDMNCKEKCKFMKVKQSRYFKNICRDFYIYSKIITKYNAENYTVNVNVKKISTAILLKYHSHE
jgi:hypothetical protein